MSNNIKLSILLATYNQGKYIEECIDGILMQNLPFPYEIIVADDYSQDNTLQIIKNKLNQSDAQFNVLGTTKNIGFKSNYKRGYNACTGEYIAVIEGDDYWTDPNRLIKHIRFLDCHHECVLSFNRFLRLNQKNHRYTIPEWNSVDDFEYITADKLAESNIIGNLSACVFRNSTFQKLNPLIFEIGFADWLLAMALGQYGVICRLKDIMSVYRIHANGLWSKMNSQEASESMLKLIDEYNIFLEYRFDNEFKKNAKRFLNISTEEKKGFKTFIKELTPPIIIDLIKWVTPMYLVKKLSKRAEM